MPTLNLATAAEVIPARGVYVTRTRDLETGREWNSLTNIGYRPTFGASDQLSIETFLLDTPAEQAALFSGRLRVEFLWRVRDERKFESPRGAQGADSERRARGPKLLPPRQGVDRPAGAPMAIGHF